MNLAQILGPTGLIDPERIPMEAPGSPLAQVTVREWHAPRQAHQHVYTGTMRFQHIRTLAAERSCLPNE